MTWLFWKCLTKALAGCVVIKHIGIDVDDGGIDFLLVELGAVSPSPRHCCNIWPNGKSVRLGSCRLKFDSESGQTDDFKIGARSFPAWRLAL